MARPASAHARSRATARAARISFSARGAFSASALTSRDTTGSDATGPGQLRLLPQHRDVGQAVTAQRDRGRQVRDDLPRIMHRPRRPPPAQRRGQATAQAGHPQCLPQQDRPGLRHQAPAVSGHGDLGGTCAILHGKSAFGWSRTGLWTSPILPGQRHFFA